MSTFLKDAAERAVRTIAQTALAAILLNNVSSVVDLDWQGVAGVSALAGLLSALTSIAAGKWGGNLSPASTVDTPQA